MSQDTENERPGRRRPGRGRLVPLAQAAATQELTPGGMSDHIVQADAFTNRLITLHEISLQIDAAQSHEGIFDVLRTELKWLVPGEISVLCSLSHFKTHFTVDVLSPSSVTPTFHGSLAALNEGILGVVMLKNMPMMVDLSTYPIAPKSLEAQIRDLGMQALLLVPLQGGDETIGALAFASSASNAYTAQDLAIARLLGSQIAVALLKMKVFEEAQKRIVQIELVNELAEKLTSTLELNELLQAATDTIHSTFKYNDVTIFLADRNEQVARLVAHTGSTSGLVPMQYGQKMSEGIVGWVASHGERILANDVRLEPRFFNPGNLKTQSELAIPIRVEREVVGVLNVEDERPHAFDDTDATVLETLCDQLGSALHNAQLYDELRRTNAKLTELDMMKSDFLSIVSHDFRAPLASIMLAAHSLLKKGDGEVASPTAQYLRVIIDQSERLITLAEDTLSITRLESGNLKYLFNSVNVERLITDAAAHIPATSRHTIQFEFEKGLGYVRGDQAKLRQVVQNLLSNAVKYSPRGGPVQITAKDHSQDSILVSVRDQGIGIPADQFGRLFRKFTRIDSEEARHIGGTGLGLWICKEIVEAHGGEIWVESARGKGSVFRFTLKKSQGEASAPRPVV